MRHLFEHMQKYPIERCSKYTHIEVVVNLFFQSFSYESLPLGPILTIFGGDFPTGVPQLLYPYQPANPLVESSLQALTFYKFERPEFWRFSISSQF